MRKLLAFTILTVLIVSFRTDNDLFVGEIHYINSFTSLSGTDNTEKLGQFLGFEQHYYTDGKNYKAFDENSRWTQLYHSSDNIFNFFTKDNTAQKIDASIRTSKKVIVTKLDEKATIAGYECSSLRIETDNEVTDYFYSPSLRVDPVVFAKHNLGEWNKFLEASGGALPLKRIITSYEYDYIWTSEAEKVTKMPLTVKDFDFPEGFSVKN